MMPRPALCYMGGKYRITPWIISHFPPHKCYLEPFGGAASVLLNKPRSRCEVYNDLDERVVTVFRAMQDRKKAKELEYRLRYTPYSREEWKLAYADQYPEDDIEIARRTIIRAFMSNGADGATRTGASGFNLKFDKDFKTANMDAWPGYPDCIKLFCDRLQGVVIENKDAIKLIKYLDSPDTLHYVDPPYMPGTWRKGDKYKHNANSEYHARLLDTLKEAKGMVVLSGYGNDLYQKELTGWRQIKKKTMNQHSETRIECLWLNRLAQERVPRKTLLEI